MTYCDDKDKDKKYGVPVNHKWLFPKKIPQKTFHPKFTTKNIPEKNMLEQGPVPY